MERLGENVRAELGRFGPTAGMAEIVSAWPEVVGEAIAANAWPACLARDGTLHVATSSSAWTCELTLLAGQVAVRLAERLGSTAPERLRFAPGRLPETGLEAESPTAVRRPVPTPEQSAWGTSVASAIADEELRSLVARAAAASLARPPSGRRV
jgi:predicted nucleic acid-binding Zn ribbon protein